MIGRLVRQIGTVIEVAELAAGTKVAAEKLTQQSTQSQAEQLNQANIPDTTHILEHPSVFQPLEEAQRNLPEVESTLHEQIQDSFDFDFTDWIP